MHSVPYGPDDRHDVDALLQKAVETRAKLVYLVNPDNPSGTALEVSRLRVTARRHTNDRVTPY